MARPFLLLFRVPLHSLCYTFSYLFRDGNSTLLLPTPRRRLPLVVESILYCWLLCSLHVFILHLLFLYHTGDWKVCFCDPLFRVHVNWILCILSLNGYNVFLRMLLVCPEDLFFCQVWLISIATIIDVKVVQQHLLFVRVRFSPIYSWWEFHFHPSKNKNIVTTSLNCIKSILGSARLCLDPFLREEKARTKVTH